MVTYLARAAREARDAAGRKPYHIAASPPGRKSADPSTVWRFEHDEAWPRNADEMIDLYAADLGIEPIELWTRALELWRADQLTPEEDADQLLDEIESEPAPADGGGRRGARGPGRSGATGPARPRRGGGARRAR
jgi:hypothetical protein